MEFEDRADEIAVIGMSCRFPGARDTAEFWKNLSAGVESIRTFTDQELLEGGTPPELLRDPGGLELPAHLREGRGELAGALLGQILAGAAGRAPPT